MHKRGWFIGLSLFLILGTAAVSGWRLHSQPKVYFKPLASQILTLDPRFTRERSAFMIARAIFGQFVSYDAYGNIQPGIFTSWDVKDEGTKYVFKIREGARFHDGQRVTAKDVAFSFHFLASKDSLVSRYFANIKGYEDFLEKKTPTMAGLRVVSDNDVEVNLSHRSFIFLAQLADPKIVVLPENLRGLSAEEFFARPVGAGAYKLTSFSNDKSELTLERFEEFFGEKSNIEIVKLKTLEKPDAIQAFKAGTVHDLEAFMLTKAEVEDLRTIANVVSTSSHSVNLLLVNGRSSLMKNPELRAALANAIDVNSIPRECDLNVKPTNGIVPVGLLGFNEAIVPAKASLPVTKVQKNQHSEIRLLAYGVPPAPCLIAKITADVKRATGLDVRLMFGTESASMKTFINGDYELLLDNLSVRGPEPFNLFTFFDPRSPHDLVFFGDRKISDKLEEIESMVGGQRAAAYASLSHYIAADRHYSIPLFTDIRVFVFNRDIKSDVIPATLMGITPFERVNL